MERPLSHIFFFFGLVLLKVSDLHNLHLVEIYNVQLELSDQFSAWRLFPK